MEEEGYEDKMEGCFFSLGYKLEVGWVGEMGEVVIWN